MPTAAAPIPGKVAQINTLENHPLLYCPMIVLFLAINAMEDQWNRNYAINDRCVDTARAAEKLRSQETLAASLTVFVQINRFNTNIPQYANSFSIRIPYPTAFTPALITYALEGLNAIYRDGYRYKKAGVELAKLVPEEAVQADLFGAFSLYEYYRQTRLMSIIDAINRIYGRDTLYCAIQGSTRPWKMHQSSLSDRFTTRWNEILTVQ